jgi:hypothetical protein
MGIVVGKTYTLGGISDRYFLVDRIGEDGFSASAYNVHNGENEGRYYFYTVHKIPFVEYQRVEKGQYILEGL